MKIISVFNNKGGVGKSTLGYHLGCILAEMDKKILFIDLDPQCNLTIYGMEEECLHDLWKEEDLFIDDFAEATSKKELFDKIIKKPRSVHFLLKPAEDGLNEIDELPPPVSLYKNVDLIPGRLSIHKYENKIAERWSGAYQSDNLSIRTITNIRRICEAYSKERKYDYVIIDTSPSLGILNKVIISTVDGFFVPAQPDMFSLYGIQNIGNSLEQWRIEFETIYKLISSEKRKKFPNKFVQFIGYTIYNAKKYTKDQNEYDLAKAHFSYAERIPLVIAKYIKEQNRIPIENWDKPIGDKAVMHTHNTFPAMSQALRCPMWKVPSTYSKKDKKFLEEHSIVVNNGSHNKYKGTKEKYKRFAKDFIERVEAI
ncbi:MAG: AAA family ATPase [Tissierellales bacterium]|jgi:cellulose biosynthesis protein BcsQ|nr:AAA family ATPase [Tissierellales bacterium]